VRAASSTTHPYPTRAKPKYDRYAWLRQIKLDPTLRPSVFKTAHEMAEYTNAETGEFYASAKTIAEGGALGDGTAMSSSTVEKDFGLLEAAGFLECIKRGKKGRGQTTRFRIVLKSQPSGISKPAKIPVSPPENPSPTPLKSQPAGMNLIEPILNLSSAARSGPSSGPVAPRQESKRPTEEERLCDPFVPPPLHPMPVRNQPPPLRPWEQAGVARLRAVMAANLTAASSG
jgi:hypothetical protein